MDQFFFYVIRTNSWIWLLLLLLLSELINLRFISLSLVSRLINFADKTLEMNFQVRLYNQPELNWTKNRLNLKKKINSTHYCRNICGSKFQRLLPKIFFQFFIYIYRNNKVVGWTSIVRSLQKCIDARYTPLQQSGFIRPSNCKWKVSRHGISLHEITISIYSRNRSPRGLSPFNKGITPNT